VAGGVYTEHVVIPFSVALLGGFDPVTWNRNLSVYETVVDAATAHAYSEHTADGTPSGSGGGERRALK
jgi:hypothetical protein